MIAFADSQNFGVFVFSISSNVKQCQKCGIFESFTADTCNCHDDRMMQESATQPAEILTPCLKKFNYSPRAQRPSPPRAKRHPKKRNPIHPDAILNSSTTDTSTISYNLLGYPKKSLNNPPPTPIISTLTFNNNFQTLDDWVRTQRVIFYDSTNRLGISVRKCEDKCGQRVMS